MIFYQSSPAGASVDCVTDGLTFVVLSECIIIGNVRMTFVADSECISVVTEVVAVLDDVI